MQWIEVGTSDAWRQHRELKWSPHLIGWIAAEKIKPGHVKQRFRSILRNLRWYEFRASLARPKYNHQPSIKRSFVRQSPGFHHFPRDTISSGRINIGTFYTMYIFSILCICIQLSYFSYLNGYWYSPFQFFNEFHRILPSISYV